MSTATRTTRTVGRNDSLRNVNSSKNNMNSHKHKNKNICQYEARTTKKIQNAMTRTTVPVPTLFTYQSNIVA